MRASGIQCSRKIVGGLTLKGCLGEISGSNFLRGGCKLKSTSTNASTPNFWGTVETGIPSLKPQLTLCSKLKIAELQSKLMKFNKKRIVDYLVEVQADPEVYESRKYDQINHIITDIWKCQVTPNQSTRDLMKHASEILQNNDNELVSSDNLESIESQLQKFKLMKFDLSTLNLTDHFKMFKQNKTFWDSFENPKYCLSQNHLKTSLMVHQLASAQVPTNGIVSNHWFYDIEYEDTQFEEWDCKDQLDWIDSVYKWSRWTRQIKTGDYNLQEMKMPNFSAISSAGGGADNTNFKSQIRSILTEMSAKNPVTFQLSPGFILHDAAQHLLPNAGMRRIFCSDLTYPMGTQPKVRRFRAVKFVPEKLWEAPSILGETQSFSVNSFSRDMPTNSSWYFTSLDKSENVMLSLPESSRDWRITIHKSTNPIECLNSQDISQRNRKRVYFQINGRAIPYIVHENGWCKETSSITQCGHKITKHEGWINNVSISVPHEKLESVIELID